MTKLYVSEYAGIDRAAGGTIGLGPSLANYDVDYTSAVASSAAFGHGTRAIRVQPDSICAVKIGAKSRTTFTSTGAANNAQRKDQAIVSATLANPIVFNVPNHGFVSGQSVFFLGLVGAGWTGLNQSSTQAVKYVVTVVDVNHFSIAVNGAGFTGTNPGGTVTGVAATVGTDGSGQTPQTGFSQVDSSAGVTAPVAAITDERLIAGEERWFEVGPGECISAITTT
jgi:hypothetical protein